MGGFPCCCADPCWCGYCNSNGCPEEFDVTLSGHSDYYGEDWPYPQCEECDNLDGTYTVVRRTTDPYYTSARCVWTSEDTSTDNVGVGQNCQYEAGGGWDPPQYINRALRISKISLWLFYSYDSFSQGLETWRVTAQYQQGDLTYGASSAGWFNSGQYVYQYKSTTPIAWTDKVNCNTETSHSYSWVSGTTGSGGLICDAESLSVSVEVAD